MKSKRFLRNVAILVAAGLLTVGTPMVRRAAAQDSGVVTVTSKKSFDATEAQLRKLVAKGGMMVLGEINQGKALAMTGLKIKVKSLFVGNPTIGNKLFKANPGVGVAVPVRVTIFETPSGVTKVSYVKPSVQLARFQSPVIQKIAGMLDQKLEKLTSMLAK